MFDNDLINAIAKKLKQKQESVAVAESVTGGLLQAAFSTAEKASEFFQGGITAYNVGQKYRHLLVEPIHALSCDSVSLKIAEHMARNVCQLFSSNYGLATTGYAARVPEMKIETPFTFFAIAKDSEIIASGKIIADAKEGLDTQLFYVTSVLQKLSDHL